MQPLDIQYWVACARFPKFGAIRLRKLYTYFPTMAAAWSATSAQLMLAGIEPAVAELFCAARAEIDPDYELEQILRHEIHVVTIQDPHYPALLKELYDAPAILFIRGSIEVLSHKQLLAVVGARRASPYGAHVTPRIVGPLATHGIGIVSGLALGIDTLAHRAALDSHGRTIAVLGCGVDAASLYPRENRDVAERIIASGGALVSEFPIGTPPLKHHFPMRNRVISGMSTGVLVVEAGAQSGALITAYSALDQNRDVFVIPGNITNPNADGSNALLKNGAVLVTGADDILEHMRLVPVRSAVQRANTIAPSLSSLEAQIVSELSLEPIHIDELISKINLTTPDLLPTITMLELRGIIRDIGGKRYVRAEER